MSAVSVQDSENSPSLADAPGLAGPAWGGGQNPLGPQLAS